MDKGNPAARVTESLRTAEQGGTPETDALIATFPNESGMRELVDSFNKLLGHARQLERQRDEAVRLLRELYEIEEGPGETDRPQWQMVRQFLATLEGKN